jgi:ornithine cyclodeaminase/alanine dehydrogenase-like protein (mu-crystallin family)
MALPILNEADIRAATSPGAAVQAIREAFRADGERRTTVPAAINLAIPAHRGEFHVKTAHIAGLPRIAVKIASGFYDNVSRGLPSGSGLMAVFDATNGFPLALLFDNGFLTDLRTGAAGAVAADCLARDPIRTVGIIGSGIQARHQAICLREVRSFQRAFVWSPSPGRLEACCAELRQRLDIEVIAARSPEEACRAADVIITATPARAPIVRSEWLGPGTHVSAVGADMPGKQELDGACLAAADLIVADSLQQCSSYGEIAAAVADGAIAAGRVHAELGEIVAGKKPGRTRDDQLTVCDLTGVGFQDTAIANMVLEAASGSTIRR